MPIEKNTVVMKKIYVFLCFVCLSSFALQANTDDPPKLNASPGFIITKDAKIITGKVSEINYQEWGSQMVFINDMGRAYQLFPSYIFGFAIEYSEDDIEKYESKYQQGIWRFLKIVEKGKHLSLYRSPSARSKDFFNETDQHKVLGANGREFWLETRRYGLVRVYALTYKKLLRNYLDDAPELVAKLGSEGYKFKNLDAIVREYNDTIKRRRRKM